MLNWLKYKTYVIQRYTVGAHINTGNEHIHIHVEATGRKKLTNAIATMKRDYNLGKISTVYKNKEQSETLPKTVTEGEYKGKINISIQMKTININDKKDIERYLQYPLKEGLVLCSNLPPEEIKQLERNAKAEYAVAQQKQVNRDKKEKKSLSDWQEFVNHLNEKEPDSIRKAYRIAIEYYKTKYEKPPTGKVIADNTERYCIKKGILTTEQLVEKYMAFY